MKKLLLLLMVLIFTTNSFSQSYSLLSLAEYDINLKNDPFKDYQNGYKWIFSISGGVGLGGSLSVDMADYMGYTGEGQVGWVTCWLHFNAGFGADIGMTATKVKMDNDDLGGFISLNSGLSTPGYEWWSWEVSDDSEHIYGSIDGLQTSSLLNMNVNLIGSSWKLLTFEMKKESLDEFLNSLLVPGITTTNYVNNALFNKISNNEEYFGNILTKEVRRATLQDEFLENVMEVRYQNLKVGEWGKIYVDVIPVVSDDYRVQVWEESWLGTPTKVPEWEWTTGNWPSGSPVSGPYYISALSKKTFPFTVKPTDSQGDFYFWLYKGDGLFTWPVDIRTLGAIYTLDAIEDFGLPYVKDVDLNENINLITITFSESISQYTITEKTIKLNTGDYSWSFENNNTQLILEPNNDFVPGENVEVFVSRYIQDVNGNRMVQDETYSFSISNDVSLSDGLVTPIAGTTNDFYNFSVTFTDQSGQNPNYVKVVVGTTSYSLSGPSGSVSTGAVYSTSKTFSAGDYNYYFEAQTASGTTVRFPETGTKSFTVDQYAAGHDIALQINSIPSTESPGGSFSASVYVKNIGNYTETNFPVEFYLYKPDGTQCDFDSKTISSIGPGAPMQSATVSLSTTSTNGFYTLNIIAKNSLDADRSNNTISSSIYVGSDIDSEEYEQQLFSLAVGETGTFYGQKIYLWGGNSNEAYFGINGGSVNDYNKDQLTGVLSDSYAIEYSFVSYDNRVYFYFGPATNKVTVTPNPVVGYQGEEKIFTVTTPYQLSTSFDYTRGEGFNDGEIIDSWMNYESKVNDYSRKFSLSLPSNTTGNYEGWIRFDCGSYYYAKVIEVDVNQQTRDVAVNISQPTDGQQFEEGETITSSGTISNLGDLTETVDYIWKVVDSQSNLIAQTPGNTTISPGGSVNIGGSFSTSGLQEDTYTLSLELVNHSDDVPTNDKDEVTFEIINPKSVTANFLASVTSGQTPLEVNFSDLSAAQNTTISSWLWDFGDGKTSTLPSPSHTYQSSGTYTISLTVGDGTLSDLETKSNYITVVEIKADFIADVTTGEAPLTVSFNDLSTSSETITSWFWDFGDGNTSTSPSPLHTYQSVGTYAVSLTVASANGDDIETKQNYIFIPESEPQVAVNSYISVEDLCYQTCLGQININYTITGSNVNDHGLYYSTVPDAVTNGTKISYGSGSGTFDAMLDDLCAGIYYVVAYAGNSGGTGYSSPEEQITILEPDLLALSTNVSTTSSSISLDLLSTGGTASYQYKAILCDAQGANCQEIPWQQSNTFVFDGLQASTTYTIEAQVQDANGCIVSDNVGSVTTPLGTCTPPWSVVNYTNTTTAYCKVTIEGIPATLDDRLGAFVGEECRGIGDIVMDNNIAYSTILIQGDAIETVKFKVWDASECIERDVCGSWQTNPGGNIGYPPDYLITDVCTNRTQPMTLNSGWNLKSFYVNTETATPGELFGGLACNVLQVKNMTKSWDPAIADFLNTLKVLTPGEGYFIKSEYAGNLDVTGPYAGSDHCLNLTTGWNLIGYPYDICQEVTTAFGDLISGGQLIQVKNMTQSYDPAVADFLNTLKYLDPGEGYFLKVNSNNSCYIIPEPTICLKSEKTQEIAECGWKFTGYEKSTVAYGEVTFNDLPVIGKAFIGAFVGDECRAVVPLIHFEEKSYASMVINGLKEEKVTFKLCSNGKIYESDTKITSKPDGTITNIIPIAFNAETNLKVQAQLSVHPNPFRDNLNITVHLSKPDDIDIAVYGADSRLIRIFQKDNATAGQHLFEWDATDLSGNSCAPGMYFIHFKGKTGNAVEKVILDSKKINN